MPQVLCCLHFCRDGRRGAIINILSRGLVESHNQETQGQCLESHQCLMQVTKINQHRVRSTVIIVKLLLHKQLSIVLPTAKHLTCSTCIFVPIFPNFQYILALLVFKSYCWLVCYDTISCLWHSKRQQCFKDHRDCLQACLGRGRWSKGRPFYV